MRMYLISASDSIKTGDVAANEMFNVIYLKTMKNGSG
jgi:hypothetical protein